MRRPNRYRVTVPLLCVLLAAGCVAPGTGGPRVDGVDYEIETPVAAHVEGCTNVQGRVTAVNVRLSRLPADRGPGSYATVVRLAGTAAREPVPAGGTRATVAVEVTHSPFTREEYRLPTGERVLRVALVRANRTVDSAARTVELAARNRNRTCVEPWPPGSNETTRVPA